MIGVVEGVVIPGVVPADRRGQAFGNRRVSVLRCAAVLAGQTDRHVEAKLATGPREPLFDVGEGDQPGVGPGRTAGIEEPSVGGEPAVQCLPGELVEPPFPGGRHEPVARIRVGIAPPPIGIERGQHLEWFADHADDPDPARQVGPRLEREPPVGGPGQVSQPGQGRQALSAREPGQRAADVHVGMARLHVPGVGKAPPKPLGDRRPGSLRVVGEGDVGGKAVEHGRFTDWGPGLRAREHPSRTSPIGSPAPAVRPFCQP
jgi:hypothetical protein